jgi:hypothetical protein
MEQYPAVAWMVRYGRQMSIVVAAAPLVCALIGVLAYDWVLPTVLAGVGVGLLLGFAFRTFAELTQIIADMLLPQ